MRRAGKYVKVNPSNPEAQAQCDRCGFWFNRSDLVVQIEWAGTHLYQTGDLVCRKSCYDKPDETLRTIILPPDPSPVEDARVPNFVIEEVTPRIIQFADPRRFASTQSPWGSGAAQPIRCTQNGNTVRILEYNTPI